MALALLLVNCLACFPGAPDSRAAGRRLRITALGDSLTAGYGLEAARTFPARLERALRQAGHDVEVANAGVSGDTTAAGWARLEWALASDPDIVIVELGANDALRGLDPAAAEANLERILAALRQREIAVLLAGMRAPRNLGAAYAEAFDAIFPRLAARHGALLYPFFLEGVAGIPALNQGDGIHPNAAGIDEIVRRILPAVRELVESVR